jgi:hypothetical protein
MIDMTLPCLVALSAVVLCLVTVVKGSSAMKQTGAGSNVSNTSSWCDGQNGFPGQISLSGTGKVLVAPDTATVRPSDYRLGGIPVTDASETRPLSSLMGRLHIIGSNVSFRGPLTEV